MSRNKILIIFFVTLLVLSGFGREFVMKNINWVIKYLSQGGGYWAQPMFNPLLKWSLSELTILKWGLTILFSFYFYVLTYLSIRLIFNNIYYSKLVGLSFLAVFIIAFVVYLYGFLINDIASVYDTVRNLMGLLQSFIPFIILYLVFRFIPQKKHN